MQTIEKRENNNNRKKVRKMHSIPEFAFMETQNFTITKIKRLMLFKEIIPVYSENHINIPCSHRFVKQFQLGLKWLNPNGNELYA
jgi:hypothetical protein